MGWRWRRSVRLVPGLRINLSSRGVGYSVGPRGLRVGRGADGRYRRTLAVPGTGLTTTSIIGSRRRASMSEQQDIRTAPPAWADSPQEAFAPVSGTRTGWIRRHPRTSAGAGLAAVLFLGSLAGGDGEQPAPARQGIVQAADQDRSDQATAEQAAAEQEARQAAEAAAAQKAAQDAAAAQAAAQAAAEAAAEAEAQRVAAEQAAAEAARAEAERVAGEQAAAAAAAQAAARAETERQAAAAAAPAPATSVHYKNCDAVRAAGAAPIHRGQPGYAKHLDRDNDGIGCDT